MPVLTRSARSLVTAAVVFFITLAVSAFVIYKSELARQEIARHQAQLAASGYGLALQQTLQHSLSATGVLMALVQQGQGQITDFEAVAATLHLEFPAVSAFALAPGGVITQNYPLEENRAAIGLDLLQDPVMRREAEFARDTGRFILAGPLTLKQGGLGLVARRAVFLDAAGEKPTFWGIVNVMMRVPEALGQPSLDHLQKQGYHFALWRLPPDAQTRQVIAQSAVLPLAALDFAVNVPNGVWMLSVAPAAGWGDPLGLSLKVALALLLGCLMAYAARQASLTYARAVALDAEVALRNREILALNRRLQATLDALPDLLFELDNEGRYLSYYSPRAELLVVPEADVIGKTTADLLPTEAAAVGQAALDEARATGASRGRQYALNLTDGTRWFELSIARKGAHGEQDTTFIALSRDITDRKNAELKLERLTKLYAALSQCNQAIVRCQTDGELFATLCRDAVNFGGMTMAWIGILDAQRHRLVPVAWSGEGTAYLEGIDITLDANDVSGQGPSGVAMREGRPYWCQDFQHDPATAKWHVRAQQFGWRASAGLPLHLRGQVVGLFSVYASEVNAFDDAAQALLLEMVMDISYALDRFADEVERKLVQDALNDSEERYRKAFQTSPDAVNINRLADGLYLDVNSGFERLMGWQHDEIVGKTSTDMHVWKDPQDRLNLVALLQRDGRCSNLEADFVKKDGGIVHGSMSAALVRFKDVECILSITRDVTEKRRADARIEQLVHFDQLTGLPNRNQVRERFDFALSLAQRSGESMAVMFLDLDHFKNINDTLGHSVGDCLLVEVSQRLSAVLRTQDTLSRMGGDEFILLLPAIGHEAAAQVAAKLIAAVAQPCQIDHHELVSTVSIGIAMYPHDGEDFETLSKNADVAMYRVKRASRNGFCFFTQEMQVHSARTLQLVNAMRKALERGEFSLHYQPQVSLQDGRIVGAEALLRWQHPELGALSPMEFIPIAEDSGQILEIGEWVLRTAVTQLKRWLDAGLPPMVIAVNLSAVQFRHANLVALVTGILVDAKLPAHHLELELTEATAMDNPTAAIDVLNQLHAHGIRMSIDDFGTGYSSLSYLKKFSIYKLKIDQSFVRDIGDDPDDKAIVTAIINLASSLGLHTIAEGVETASQLAFLREQGCKEVQGYYFSRPLPAGQFEAFVRAQPQA